MKKSILFIAIFTTAALAHANENTRTPGTPLPKPTPILVSPSSNASAVGGNSYNYNFNEPSANAHSAASSTSSSRSEANNALNLKFDAQLRNPVATATGPALAASTGACMGSSSAGAQGVALGISVGTTWTDENCDRRYDSIRMQELGFNHVAVQLMCDKPAVREAMRKTGTPCIDDTGDTTAQAPASVNGYTGNDPIVRARMAGK